MGCKRVLINFPAEFLEEIDRVAKSEHRNRSEFIREALRDRISRSDFASSLSHLRARAGNRFPERDVDRDIAEALSEAPAERKKVSRVS